MWKTFTHSNEPYMLKYCKNDKDITLFLTNLKQLWSKTVDFPTISANFQELNPSLDLEIDEVVAQVVHLLENEPEIDIKVQENAILLEFKSKIRGFDSKFNIKYNILLTEASKEEFAEQLTLPLIHSVKYLEEQQHRLCVLLARKDRELDEYQLEYNQISRNDLKTEKFDQNSVNCPNAKLILNVFKKSTPFWDCLSEKHGQVDAQVEEVAEEPWNCPNKRVKIYSKDTVAKKIGIQYNKK